MNNIFSEQLKKLRADKGYSQEALAEKLFISRQAISKWEKGAATPELDTLIKLADILKVSLDELVLGKIPGPSSQEEDDEDINLNLLKGREFVINPETGEMEKRDGLAIGLALLSEYWYVVLMLIILCAAFLF